MSTIRDYMVMVGDRFENLTLCLDSGGRASQRIYDGVFTVTAVLPGAGVELDGECRIQLPAAALFDPKFGWVRVNEGGAAIRKVEISVGTNQKPGEVARQVGVYLAHDARFRTSSPYTRSYGDAHQQPPEMAPIPPKPTGYPDRSAVDALLLEDARLHPEFAAARRAAVLADFEIPEGGARPRRGLQSVRRLLGMVEEYERVRGGRSIPGAEASTMAREDAALAVYEAARTRC